MLRKIRERREAEKKAEKEAMEAHSNVKSTKTLVDKAAEEQRLRKAEDRRIGKLPRHPSCFQTGSLMFDVFCACAAQESKELYSKTSSYDLNRDPVYQHSQRQKEEERNAEKEAKESLLNFTRNGTGDWHSHAAEQGLFNHVLMLRRP